MMKLLVACEESQVVTMAFRSKGIEAYSCDLKPCSGGHPEWHIQQDALAEISRGGYDMVIAHPPCTYLSNAGAHLLFPHGGFSVNEERYAKLQDARSFFMKILNCGVEKLAVENPTPLKAAALPKPSQIIQPYMFGEPYTKRTCLWLRGLPPLMATFVIDKRETESWTHIHRSQTVRSKTFPGIAEAMADQWGNYGC